MIGRRPFIAIAVVLGLAAAGVAYATIPDSNGVIHGCYLNKGGALRVIDDAATSCRSGETSLDWNQTGPQGKPGISLFARVDLTGELESGSGAVSAAHIGPGLYTVTFDRPVSQCAPVVSGGDGTSSSAYSPVGRASVQFPPFDTNEVLVGFTITQNFELVGIDTGFQLIVAC